MSWLICVPLHAETLDPLTLTQSAIMNSLNICMHFKPTTLYRVGLELTLWPFSRPNRRGCIFHTIDTCFILLLKPNLPAQVKSEKNMASGGNSQAKGFYVGPRREKTCLRGFANNTGADQPAHPRSLISAFVIRVLESTISKLATSEISTF